MAGNTFKYQRLESRRTIRFLLLHQGEEDHGIACSLQHVSLDHFPGYYEAISYAWGDPSDLTTISVNSRHMQITKSLHAALVRFRHTDTDRTLWVDALCINQQDAAEKSTQIPLLADIYNGAESVLVHLGPGDPDDVDIVATVNEARALLLPRADQPDTQDAIDRFDWGPLYRTLQRPWFTRKWVVQEVAFAKFVLLFCGQATIPFFTFGELLAALSRTPQLRLLLASWPEGCARGVSNVRFLYITQQYILRRGYPSGSDESAYGDLFDLMRLTTDFDCSDPRDHINSLWSLTSKGDGQLMKPDYRRGRVETFVRFASWCLLQRQKTEVLSLAPLSDPSGDLPSWVPNFGVMKNARRVLASQDRPLFKAGGPYTAGSFAVVKANGNAAASGGGRFLKCKIKTVDTVDKLNCVLDDAPMPEPPVQASTEENTQHAKKQVDWLRACERLAAEGDGMCDSDGKLTAARYEQFWRTVMCEIRLERHAKRAEAATGEIFRQLYDHLGRLFPHDADAGSSDEDSGPYLGHCAAILPSVDRYAAAMRFCTTKEGKLGQAPAGAQEGDEICIIKGAQVPFVVRAGSESGKYRIVGEAYVHGVMDGEMLDGKGDFQDVLFE